MGSLNKVILIGNLGRDMEKTVTTTGFPIGRFSMATTRRQKNGRSGQWEEKTEWHRIVMLGDSVESVGQYLVKGKQVCVEGRIETRSWDDKDGQKRYMTEIICDRVQLLGGGGSDGGADRRASGRRGGRRTADVDGEAGGEYAGGGDVGGDAVAVGPDDDDVPF